MISLLTDLAVNLVALLSVLHFFFQPANCLSCGGGALLFPIFVQPTTASHRYYESSCLTDVVGKRLFVSRGRRVGDLPSPNSRAALAF